MKTVADIVDPPRRFAARPEQRRFRAFNVGLAKTGTRSIAGIFAGYRSLHELLFADSVRAAMARRSGAVSEGEFRAFLRRRDEIAHLDVDSSSCNCYYVDALADEFGDAKFIFVIRDCFSWLDSFVNMVLFAGPLMGSWMEGYVRDILGPGYHRNLAAARLELEGALPDMIGNGFRYWSATNRFVLEHLPPDRSLVLRTPELSESIPALATFVGVPAETLKPEMSRLNGAQYRYRLLGPRHRHALATAFETDCSELMREFFPEVAHPPAEQVLYA